MLNTVPEGMKVRQYLQNPVSIHFLHEVGCPKPLHLTPVGGCERTRTSAPRRIDPLIHTVATTSIRWWKSFTDQRLKADKTFTDAINLGVKGVDLGVKGVDLGVKSINPRVRSCIESIQL